MKIQSVIQQFNTLTRAKDWRLNFVPFVIACVYLWINLFKITLSIHSLIVFILSIATTMGFAALGYFINEYFDQAQDKAAGKINKLSFISGPKKVGLFTLILLICLLPWLVLPADKLSYTLIGLEISLFIIYSAPLIRLKETVFIAILVDTAYAYLVPCLLSYHTYALLSESSHTFFPWFFFTLLLFIGIRNMLLHQIKDVLGDQKAGFKSLPQYLGVKRTQELLKMLIILEITLVIAAALELANHQIFFALWFVLVIIYLVFSIKDLREVLNNNAYFDLLPVRHFLDLLYILWFPLCQLLLIIFIDWKWIVLLPIHLMLLVDQGHLIRFSKFIWHDSTKPVLSALVNYPIYYSFRLFGVDLKQEKKSAVEYVKSKLSS
jgi:4-hydroxybenzoate polyprenyltransferase